MRALHAAVVGAGPSGLYAVQSMLAKNPDIRVDVFDALPTPLGLLRYGVAPDHLKMKALGPSLEKVLANPRVRLLSNVTIGRDVTVEQLRDHYDAVVHAFGAERSRRLGVSGEHLNGSMPASDLISWYSGKPGVSAPHLPAKVESAVVIGAGNVALDVARFLTRQSAGLHETDVPSPVLAWLDDAGVKEIHIVVRRSPKEVKFSSKELREIVDLPDVAITVHGASLSVDDATPMPIRRLVRALTEAAAASKPEARVQLHFRFMSRPLEICGHGAVERVTLASPSGVYDIPADLVISAIGQLGTQVPGVPSDSETSVVPAQGARVVREGVTSTGEYVAGWARRGATGVLAANRADGEAVAAAIAEDADVLAAREPRSPEALVLSLRGRRSVVDLDGWERIRSAELDEGKPQGRGSVKIPDVFRLLQVAAASDALVREEAS